MLRVAVCGENAIAHSIAAVCGWRGHAVRVLAARPARWAPCLRGSLPDRSGFAGPLDAVADDARTVVANADIVFVCVRHAELAGVLRRIAPHVASETLVGAVPGFGGFGLIARRLLPGVETFFGTQRIPFVVRRHVTGRAVTIGGIRRQTFVGTMSSGRARPAAALIERLLGVPTVPISHFVNVELSPSNSIVNPARVYALSRPRMRHHIKGDHEFFLDWNMDASRVLLALDRELQEGRRLIPRDTSFVAPILFQYDANDARTLTDRMRGLHALAGRRVPLRRSSGGITIDPRSDYVLEDIDYGIQLVRDMLRLAGARTPMMDRILQWRRVTLGSLGTPRPHAVASAVAAFATIEDLASALD